MKDYDRNGNLSIQIISVEPLHAVQRVNIQVVQRIKTTLVLVPRRVAVARDISTLFKAGKTRRLSKLATSV